MHWPVAVELLRPLVPAHLAIDLYRGEAYVGLIPFNVLNAGFKWMPEALGLDFLETNVRTYVKVDGEQPGVYFFSLDAASRLAVIVASTGLGLPYFYSEMAFERRDNVVEYKVERLNGTRPRLALRYEIGEPRDAAPDGSLDHFLLERRRLHVERGDSLWIVTVQHEPYPLRQARVIEIKDSLIEAGGLPEPSELPPLVHFSPGVDVQILAPEIRQAQQPA